MATPTHDVVQNAENAENEDELPQREGLQAIDHVELKVVRSAADMEDTAVAFKPEFTHQVFDDEVIAGYSNDLKVKIYQTGGSLQTMVRVTFTNEEEKHDDVFASLENYDIKNFITSEEEFLQKLADEAFEPAVAGVPIREYSVEDRKFVIYKGDFSKPSVKEYHRNMQMFAIWYIEAASFINETDDRWELLTIFEKVDGKHFFVGYSTIYPFYVYPESERLRVSQVIVLPPYRRMGHGQELLSTVYEDAQKRNAVEVTVEDPSPEFQRLRDLVDLKRCKTEGFFSASEGGKKRAFGEDDGPDMKKVRLDFVGGRYEKEKIEAVQKKLKMPKAQVTRCFEVSKYLACNTNDDEELRGFRLSVKQRLNKVNQAELSSIQDAGAKKARLDELYKFEEQSYKELSDSARKHLETVSA